MKLPPEAPALPERLIGCARILPDRFSILPFLPKDAAFAEVGVGFGDFSAAVMEACRPRRFIAIDNFELHHETELWGRPPADVFGTGTHRDFYEARFADALAGGVMTILAGQSGDCLEQVPDRSLDIVYVDADHRYEFVKRDIDIAGRKVRENGWMIVNDYIMVAALEAPVPYGVVNATHEFMLKNDWGMQYLALHTRMFCDVVLRPAHLLNDDSVALRAEVAALRASRSWRLTAPLRGVGGSLRHLLDRTSRPAAR